MSVYYKFWTKFKGNRCENNNKNSREYSKEIQELLVFQKEIKSK